MKGKRLLATMLALLLVVSLLPMTAMAEETFETENGTIAKGQEVTYNLAENVFNDGTVTNNGPLASSSPTPSILYNNGTVVNNGGSSDSEKGIVVNNKSDGTVEHNNPKGTVENNYGLVGKVVDGKLDTTGNYGNSGKVENNQTGGVVVNNKDGKVENNLQGGVVVNNSGGDDSKGVVENNYSSGDGTNPGVINNGGKVSANRAGGTVVNNEGGYVNDNYSNGDGTNPGVINNGGTVNINNGTMDNYAGQVHFNNEGGKILNNYGTVGALPGVTSGPEQYNCGTVETNHISGWVANNTTGENGKGVGEVNTNYGTVYQLEKDRGWIYYYGLHGEDENKETDTKYTEEGYSLGHTAGAEVNLDDTAASYQREGYKLSSYTVWTYDKTSTADDKLVEQNVGDRTKYTINAPTLLKLVWEKIVTAVASSGGGEAVSSSYNPKYIGLGSVVTINGSRYKVVEIKDDALVVVTFDALPDEDVKDLDALFAKLFTAEQQKQIKNIGQLLDAEDVLAVFGKPGNHPVFEISKDLPK